MSARFRAVLFLLAGVLLLAFPGFSATADTPSPPPITSSGPLTYINVDQDLNCAVHHTGDTYGEFYSDTACGTFLVVDGTVYSPASIPAGQPATGWTPVSQSNVTGDGTQASPYTFTTKVAAGSTGVTLSQTDSYVVGQESYRTDITVQNNGTARSVILYRAADCYLADSDSGLGQVNTSSGAVSCKSSLSDRIEQWLPLSSGSRYYEAGYSEVWSWINTKAAFPNTCRCTEDIDNGAGLSWTIPLGANQSATRSSLITFSPVGAEPLSTTKTVNHSAVSSGDTVRYTIDVHNPGQTDATLQTVTDNLPSGFGYVDGSTTGATTSDPSSSGGTLTWSTPATVPAGGDVTLSFDATAASASGTYYNNAGGTAENLFVTPTGDTAPVTVTAAEGTGSVSISVNPTTVTWPATTDVSGVVKDSGGDPVSGQQVELWAKRYGGSYALLDTETSSSTGAISYTDRPSTQTTYQWRVPGTSITSDEAVVNVRPALTAAAYPPFGPAGQQVVFGGLSAPVRAGAPVIVQQLVNGEWVTVKRGTFRYATNGDPANRSPYSMSLTPSGIGVLQYRVVVPADSGRLEAISPVLIVHRGNPV